jgi:threonine-phosphate decarboxylase
VKNTLEPIEIDRTHGGSAPENCIDFSTSLNPLGPPAQAIQAYHEAIEYVSKYPPPYPRRLESRIAEWIGIDPRNLIVANGSTQLIYLVARVLRLNSPFIVIPVFSEISNGVIAAGSVPLPIFLRAEDSFRFEFRALREALENAADGVFLGRPNSPTGTLIGLEEMAAVARECNRRGVWCVVDEAFIEFADDPASAATLVGSIPKLLVLRSLTKIFSIPGLRLGYALGPTDFISKLRGAIEPWSVNAIAEHVAFACLDVAETVIAQTRRFVAQERARFEHELRDRVAPMVFPSRANFFMFRIREQNCSDFSRYMLSQGIAIRDLSALPGCGPGLYRVAVRSRSDNDRFLAAAESWPNAVL